MQIVWIVLLLFFKEKISVDVIFSFLCMKVSRPSYIPFWGTVTIEKHVPLSMVIDIIIEQGTVQAFSDAFCNMITKITISDHIHIPFFSVIIGSVPMQSF